MNKAVRIHLLFFSVVEFLAAGLIAVSLLPQIKWYEADLYLPNSINPLHRNTTAELSVSSKWGIERVDFHLYRGKNIEHEFNISSLTTSAFLATFTGVPENTLVLLHDLERASDFSYSASILTVGLLGLGGSMTFFTALSPCLWKRAGMFKRGACCLCKPARVLPAVCVVAAVTALLAALIGFLAVSYYVITLESDARVVLPSLMKELRLLCLLHPKGQCFVKPKILTGVILYVVGTVLSFITSLSFFVAWGSVSPYSAFDSAEAVIRKGVSHLLKGSNGI